MAYDANDLIIKQIQASNGLHELDAKYFDGHKWSDVTELVEAGFEATVMTTLPTVTNANYNTYRNTLALKADENAEAGIYLEYIVIKGGSAQTPTYTWEQIGSTKTDFVIPTQPSVTLTVHAASATVNTTSNGSQTATGSASIAYDKATSIGTAGAATATVEITVDKLAPTVTENAGGTGTKNTSQLATATVASTEDGAHTHSVTTTAHSHTVNLTSSSKTVVTGIDANTGNAGTTETISLTATSHTHAVVIAAHSHTVHLTSSSETVVTGITQTGNAGAHTHSISVSSSSTPVVISASVNNNILSFSTANVISSVNADTVTGEAGGHTHGITPTTAIIKHITGATLSTSAPSGIASAAGAHTHVLDRFPEHNHSVGKTTTIINHITGATLATSAPNGTATSAGTHSHNITIAAHSHTYVELKAHTHAIATISATYSGDATIGEHSHTINYTTTTVTGTASVAVASHTHSVVIPAHTHTITVPAHNHSTATGS